MRRFVYLVPGFFGFSELGEMNYFQGVTDVLHGALRERGVDATIVSCATKPTASIRRRADALIDEVVDSGGLEADEIHFVGHSTGGLDLRLLLTPDVRLRDSAVEQRIGALARSCVTVSTPHYGTPLASFFTTLPGRHALEVLAVLATTRAGRHTIVSAAWLLRAIARLDDRLGRRETWLDTWAERALSKLSTDGDDPMWEFMREISQDQGAVIQLTPETMNLFNAAVVDREGVNYASVVTAAPPPEPAGLLRWRALRRLAQPSDAVLRSVFSGLWLMASREHRHYPYPHPGENVLDASGVEVGFELDHRANDGIVPALSQVYGEVLDVVVADHLDVVGQYDNGEPFSDWLPSGSRFDQAAFDRTWSAIADAISA